MCDQYKEEVFDASQSLIMGILPGPERKPNYVVKAYKCNSSISLIVGGSEAESAEFPHMAAIGWKDQRGAVSFKCGGSLISNKFVLTVAHCTYVDRWIFCVINDDTLKVKTSLLLVYNQIL